MEEIWRDRCCWEMNGSSGSGGERVDVKIGNFV